MSRIFRTLAIVLLAASCGGGGPSEPPSNLDNACDIVRERPQYYRAFKAAERKWGVPVHVQMATIHQDLELNIIKADFAIGGATGSGLLGTGRCIRQR